MSGARGRPRPGSRKVIEVSTPLHECLWRIKKERQQKLDRQVTFTEIIEGWRTRAEGLDLLAAHVQLRGASDGT